jgi:sialic acid synthase SpsE
LISLDGRRIGPGEPPYRIADAGVAHTGDLQLGYKLVETAGASGAHAIVLERGTLSSRDFKCVLGHAGHIGLTPLGAPADEEDLSLLVSMDVPGLRVADVDVFPTALLERTARTARPMILSLGNATMDAAAAVVEACLRAGSGPLALLAPDPRMMEAWKVALPACAVGLLVPPGENPTVIGADLTETPHRLPSALSRRNRS